MTRQIRHRRTSKSGRMFRAGTRNTISTSKKDIRENQILQKALNTIFNGDVKISELTFGKPYVQGAKKEAPEYLKSKFVYKDDNGHLESNIPFPDDTHYHEFKRRFPNLLKLVTSED
jgi:hypothetical protein|tara:strand:+ start:3481 stop:3831 length:351 start_codon:yes stop_codon:yes gene_type:complete